MTETTSVSGRKADAGAALLAGGGILAGFGAAACCALPLMLASAGLGSAWLFSVAAVTGPYQIVLLGAAALGLTGAAFLLWRGRRQDAAVCATGGACRSNLALRRMTLGALAFGCVLLVLGATVA